MANRIQIEAFWQRWGYKPDDKAELGKLRNRLDHIVKEKVWRNLYKDPDFWKELALLHGRKYDHTDVGYDNFDVTALKKDLGTAKDLFELAQALQFMLWSITRVRPELLEGCIESFNDVFALTPGLPVRVAKSADGATIYPGGAALLDELLIQENLIWLAGHDKTLRAFQQALAIYLTKDTNKYRNLLDNLRFALEQLLRDVLGNQKSLENQKDVLLPWIKSKGLHDRVIGMYHDLLFKHFSIYQNDAVKHGEKYSLQEVEFMIYLTGTFMRLLIEAWKTSNGHAAVTK